MRNWLGLATLALVVALTGCADPEHDMTAAFELQKDAFDRAGLQFYWDYKLPLHLNEEVINTWLIDDAIYYLTDQQRLFCYDPAIGTQRWIYPIPERNFVFPPSHGPDVNITPKTMGIQGIAPLGVLDTVTYKPLVINTSRVMYLINRKTGEELRRIDVSPEALSAGGVIDARNFFAPLLDGTYVAFDLQEGVRTPWKGTIADEKSGVIKARPQYLDGHVYVAATNGMLHCRIVDEKGRLEWGPKNLVAAITATPYVDRRFCLVPVEDGRLYAFDPLTGQPKWLVAFFPTQYALTTSPQAGANTIFQYSARDRFYAIDPEKGKKKWENRTAQTVVGIFQNVVYAISTENDLLAITEVTGEVKYKLPMTGFEPKPKKDGTPREFLCAPNTSQNYAAIYVASADGRIACIRPVSAGRIKVDMMR